MRGTKSLIFLLGLIVVLGGCVTFGTGVRRETPVMRVPPPKPEEIIRGVPVAIMVKVKAPTYRALNTFKQALSRIKGVKDIYQKKFSVSQDSELEIRYIGSTEKLADEIVNNIHIPGTSLEIAEFDQVSITVIITPLPTKDIGQQY